MMHRREQLHASLSYAQQAVHFYVGGMDGEGDLRHLTENGWRTQQPGEAAEPSFTVSIDTAQALFEELWSQGFRSVNDRGGSDRLDQARQDHIEDLRKAAKLK